jgi:hypothetical protein
MLEVPSVACKLINIVVVPDGSVHNPCQRRAQVCRDGNYGAKSVTPKATTIEVAQGAENIPAAENFMQFGIGKLVAPIEDNLLRLGGLRGFVNGLGRGAHPRESRYHGRDRRGLTSSGRASCDVRSRWHNASVVSCLSVEMLRELSISSAEGKRPTRRAPYDQLAVQRRGAGVAEQGCLLSSFTPKG